MATYPQRIFFIYFVFSIIGELCAQPVQVRTYHDPEKSVLKEIYYIDDSTTSRLTGPYKSYFISGNVEREGFYKDNLPDSIWVYYYENGNVKMKGMLKYGTSHGLWEYFFENGNLNMAGMIIDSKREGNWKYYYENGDIKSEGNYKNNVKHGIWNYFYEEGDIKAQAYYENGNGQYKEFYPSGKIKAEGLNVNGKSDSTWIFYFESGNTRARGDYANGKRIGPWIFYHNNKLKSAEGTYVDGEKNGKWVHYHENGEISSEGAIIAGQKEGYWRFFDEDGIFKAEGIFESDDGKYTEYYESGKIKAEGQILNGKNHGTWYYYYEDGTKEGKCVYEEGNGEYIGYYPDGTIKMKGKIKDGVNVGIWELYDGEGDLAGYYRPYYEENKPIYKLVEKTAPERGNYIKPEYKFKSYKSRYFDPVINEYKGVILATNPLAMIIGQLPFSVEYYIEERLGYELQVSILRDPFFKSASQVELNKVFNRGWNVALKQKFYHPEGRFGMFYFGHEVRLTSAKHYANAIDSANYVDFGGSFENIRLNTSETRFEYALFVGDRWMQLFGERYKNNSVGFTIDAFVGFGFGYRLYKENYPTTPEYEKLFENVNTSKFVISPRLGVNFGFVF
jgi:antitoxin component YwqK of YwqJK toxin-antitoxin module